ncbi:MAG: hypothetical protein EP297_08075 [Gammaproteobacteria bacterium]|nr:MAG: hypothetical protein EP297_08075 [Gammaproteobacteria bacterium]
MIFTIPTSKLADAYNNEVDDVPVNARVSLGVSLVPGASVYAVVSFQPDGMEVYCDISFSRSEVVAGIL